MTVAVRFLLMGIFLVASLVWLGATMYVFDDADHYRAISRRVDALEKWRTAQTLGVKRDED